MRIPVTLKPLHEPPPVDQLPGRLQGIDGLNYRQLALLSLVKIGLLEQRTIGNAMHFSVGDTLRDLLVNAEKGD